MHYLCDEYIDYRLCSKLSQSGKREMQRGILPQDIQQILNRHSYAGGDQRPMRILNHHFIAAGIVLTKE